MADEHAHAAPAPYHREENPPRLWVHHDYAPVAPIKSAERFGSVEDWAAYLLRFGKPETSLVMWNARGFRATLDYAGNVEEQGGSNWTAEYAFTYSPEWLGWQALCKGAYLQPQAIERLEDLLDTIIDPPAADLVNLLRDLRVTSQGEKQIQVRADGGYTVSRTEEANVRGGPQNAIIPGELKIDVPVLVGHFTEVGAKATFVTAVRVRASLSPSKDVMFRFSMPTAERVLELVYADRLEKAKNLLDGWEILRAAD